MEFRLARPEDTPELEVVFKKIIIQMEIENLSIWDDVYPCVCFADDIRHRRLYVMTENSKIISAFTLSETNAGAACFYWTEPNASVLYLDRFGVDVDFRHCGIGSLMISEAKTTAIKLGAAYLRLLVVNFNEPALRLYERNGFKKVAGSFNLVLDTGEVLTEHAYEIKLS